MTFLHRLVVSAPPRFQTPEFQRSTASVAEQMTLSAFTFTVAIIVASASGIAALGIYSVVLIIANYLKSLFATLFQKQMVLAISAKHPGTQKGVFYATAGMQVVFAGILCLLTTTLVSPLKQIFAYDQIDKMIFGVAIYVLTGSMFDLFRQFLYATDQQVYSLKCTISAVAVQAIGLAILLSVFDDRVPLFCYFLVLGIGFLIGCLLNENCLNILRETRWKGLTFAFNKFSSYWAHSRFSVIGMSITWAQNQSATPLLMFLTNPLTVGYFSLARLLVMPLIVINQGLINSSTPQLRRIAEKETPILVSKKLRSLSILNVGISVVYLIALAVAQFSGLLNNLLAGYSNIVWFLGFWAVYLLVTMQRFWISQFFIVHLQFKYLVKISAFIALFTFIGMITMAYIFDSASLALFSFIAGEILFIILLENSRRDFVASYKL